MAKYLVGIDLHKTVAQVCVLDAAGVVQEEWRHALASEADGQALLGRLASWGSKARLAVEALGCNRWLVNGLKARGLDVLVAHAQALDLKKLGRKTDRRDAYEIARRLYLGDLERTARSHYASEEVYGRRKLLRLRHVQRQALQRALNQVRALLNAYLVRPPCRSLLTKRGMAWLEQVELPTPELTFLLRHLLKDLVHQRAQIGVLDTEIAKLAREPEVAALVTTLPGVGVLSASTLRYELGDVARFDRTRQVAAYVGLVPRVSQSGEGHGHHGRLTKRGNAEVRWILSQWAVRLLTHEPVVKTWAARHARRLSRNKLRTALARRLLIGVYKTMRTGEAFSMERCLGLPAAA